MDSATSGNTAASAGPGEWRSAMKQSPCSPGEAVASMGTTEPGTVTDQAQNFDPFAFQKPRLGHMREKALLFILVWLGTHRSDIMSDHVKMLYPHRDRF